MTQEALGATLAPKMTRASIANIEAGTQRVLLHTAVRLAEVLQIELAELLSSDVARAVDPTSLAAELADKLPVTGPRARSILKKLFAGQTSVTQ